MAGQASSDRQDGSADADDGSVGAEEGGWRESTTDEYDWDAADHVGHPVDEGHDVSRRLRHRHLVNAEGQDQTTERDLDVRQAQVEEPE